MKLTRLEPRKALNKAFLKKKPLRSEIEDFKTNLITLLGKIRDIDKRPKDESEEHLKNDLRDFLRDTYYRDTNAINTKDRKDLVIHLNKSTDSEVGVIIEAKRPSNTGEMVKEGNLNKKALHELILYYLHERIEVGNFQVKQLVITNINEWYIIDANHFDKHIYNNTQIKKLYDTKISDRKNNPHFYEEIEKIVSKIDVEIPCVYFDIRDYRDILHNENKEDDKELIALYKILSPEHLLKLSFANDSNSLDKNFYSELLHIIGLTEIKDGSKKLIQRHKPENRNPGSLIENTIEQLESLDKLSRLQNARQFGETTEKRLFNLAMELTITWVNRILFLKLLEAQLISYHKGDKSYSFLNSDLIKDYDKLNGLFFQVLARKPNERIERVRTDFSKVPYLNSSLFEPTELEHNTLFVSQLDDNVTLPLLSTTVIKDNQGKKTTGTKNPLNYFLSFLDAYDFASEGSEDIQEENKTLINASVLGLIFEKINGYKDGSFYTPSFITMYMCKETIRRTVVQKFNETKNWDCKDFNDLKNKDYTIIEANAIVNSIKICDPAVGSGHFLVSALNEIILIKSNLGILSDQSNIRLKNCNLEIINDELIVTDEDDIPFRYNPKDKESQRIQETLFHEKQIIIENCLFGVDINPNSVKICRLRLWIELLKNAYYRTNTNELETLPNIDINIKCGNSLISRFGLDADLKDALKKSKLSIDDYKNAVNTYRNADSKEQKREMEELIGEIKSNFRSEINANSKEIKDLIKDQNEYYTKYESPQLFEATLNKAQVKNKKELAEKIKKNENAIEEIKSNKIYENAFEWRFEFPDILNDEGDFVGFDVIIGNPPYVDIKELNINDVKYYFKNYKTASNRINLYSIFIERTLSILNNNSNLSFIIPNSLLMNSSYLELRKLLEDEIELIIKLPDNVFEEAIVETIIFLAKKNSSNEKCDLIVFGNKEKVISIDENRKKSINKTSWKSFEELKFNIFIDEKISNLLLKINNDKETLKELADFTLGITPYDKYTGHSKELIVNREFHSKTKLSEEYKPLIKGENINPYIVSENINEYLKYGKWLGASREERFFVEPRVIVRQIISGNPGKIYAGYTDKSLYFTQIGFSVIAKNNLENKFILCLLNSSLINFYHKYMFLDIEKDLFQKILIENCKKLPIPKISKESQQPFISKVNEIITLKSEEPQADTNMLEQEINAMIYELYDLTEEEIEIVEGSQIKYSRNQFNSISV